MKSQHPSTNVVGGADGAAIRLGINRTTLMYRLRNLGIYPKLYS